MSYPVPGLGRNAAGDVVGGEEVPRVKLQHGAAGAAVDASASAPLPVREPVNGDALGKGGVTASGASQTLTPANAARKTVEVSNGGDSGVWLAFGATAVVGQGTYLPGKATGYWPTTAAVTVIVEAGGTGGPVGFTEW